MNFGKVRGLAERRYVAFVPLAMFAGFFVVSLVWSSIVMQPQANRSSAETVTVGVSLDTVIEMTAPDVANMGVLSVSSSALSTVDLPISVSTNNPTGYTMTMNASSAENCLRRAVDLSTACGDLAASDKVLALPNSNVATGAFPINYWGFSLSPYATWNPVPDFNYSTTLRSTSVNTVDDVIAVRFGAKGGLGMSVGTYTNDVYLSAVANYVPSPYVTEFTPTSGGAGETVSIYGHTIDEGAFSYTVTVPNELRNILVGDDLAGVTVELSIPDDISGIFRFEDEWYFISVNGSGRIGSVFQGPSYNVIMDYVTYDRIFDKYSTSIVTNLTTYTFPSGTPLIVTGVDSTNAAYQHFKVWSDDVT